MIVGKNSLGTSRYEVGFVPVEIGNDVRCFGKVVYQAGDNTSPIRLGPAKNNMEFSLHPGCRIEVERETSRMWAVSDDIGQIVEVIQL